MLITNYKWYFFKKYGKNKPNSNQIKVYCKRSEYDVLLLVALEVLEKLRYEKEVAGFQCKPSLNTEYPLYCVGVNTDNIQPIIDKYPIIALLNKTVKCPINSKA